MIKNPPRTLIYLASRSPRRRELLKQIGVAFEVLVLRENPARGPDVDESQLPAELPDDYVRRVCRVKAEVGWDRVVQRRLRRFPVLAADTVVCVDDKILGKPADPAPDDDDPPRTSCSYRHQRRFLPSSRGVLACHVAFATPRG